MFCRRNNFTIDNATGEVRTVDGIDREGINNDADSFVFVVVAIDSGEPPMTGATLVKVVVKDINDNLPYYDQPFVTVDELELATGNLNFSFKVSQ